MTRTRWAALFALALALLVIVFLVALNSGDERQDVANTVKSNERRVSVIERKVLPIQRVLVNKDILRVGPRGLTGGRGPLGRTGDAGASGRSGLPGAQGLAGLLGADGPAGTDGTQGEPGASGEQGSQGEQGPQGSPGDTGPPPDLTGRTWTCEPTADVLDPPTTTTCTLNP